MNQNGYEYVRGASLWARVNGVDTLVVDAYDLRPGANWIQFNILTSQWEVTTEDFGTFAPTAEPTSARYAALTLGSAWGFTSSYSDTNADFGWWTVKEITYYSDTGCTTKLDTSANNTIYSGNLP
jgi:hypothetical protein